MSYKTFCFPSNIYPEGSKSYILYFCSALQFSKFFKGINLIRALIHSLALAHSMRKQTSSLQLCSERFRKGDGVHLCLLPRSLTGCTKTRCWPRAGLSKPRKRGGGGRRGQSPVLVVLTSSSAKYNWSTRFHLGMSPSLAKSLVFCAALSAKGGLNSYLKVQDPKTNKLR